ncbi:MAG: hypothetical protein Q9M92_18065 [Enterobacterales bacterium]|nr:hypothetical protein [Enterobacterales bacterium]
MKSLIIIILFCQIYSVSGNNYREKPFSYYAKKSYSTMVVEFIKKEKSSKLNTCFKVTAKILESSNNLKGIVTFWVNTGRDFFDGIDNYLLITFKASDETSLKCGEGKRFIYVQSRLQSMFPLLDRSSCDLSVKCNFYITRRNVFGEELSFGRRYIKNYIYEHNSIYAEGSISNIMDLMLNKRKNLMVD